MSLKPSQAAPLPVRHPGTARRRHATPFNVDESVIFTTWNPWSDPIDPIHTETEQLGPVTTDANGQFSIPNVLVDHVGASSLLDSAHEVDFAATYDMDGDDNQFVIMSAPRDYYTTGRQYDLPVAHKSL